MATDKNADKPNPAQRQISKWMACLPAILVVVLLTIVILDAFWKWQNRLNSPDVVQGIIDGYVERNAQDTSIRYEVTTIEAVEAQVVGARWCVVIAPPIAWKSHTESVSHFMIVRTGDQWSVFLLEPENGDEWTDFGCTSEL